MKKIATTCLAIFFFAAAAAFAQFTPSEYLASEGLQKASDQAETSGMTNPELIFAGTINRSIAVGQFNLDVSFNLDNGKSDIWLYTFRSADDHDNTASYAVIYFMSQFVAFPVALGDYIADIPFTADMALPDFGTIIDSDRMAEIFRNYDDFTNYMDAHPEPETMMIGLFMNSKYEFMNFNEPIWAAMFIDLGDTYVCGIQAISEDVLCSDISSVDDASLSESTRLFPNPAANCVNLEFPSDFALIAPETKIFDSFGSEIQISDVAIYGNRLVVPVSNLSPGAYFIKAKIADKIIYKPFVIIK